MLRPNARSAEIAAAIERALGTSSVEEVSLISSILANVASGQISSEQAEQEIASHQELREALGRLSGKSIDANKTVFSFGADNQLGDIAIRDVAGGNITYLTVNIASSMPPDNQRKPSKRLLFVPLFALVLAIVGGIYLLYPFITGSQGQPAAVQSSPTAAAVPQPTVLETHTAAAPTSAPQETLTSAATPPSAPQRTAPTISPVSLDEQGSIAAEATNDWTFTATANAPVLVTLATQDDLAFYFEVLDPDGTKVFGSNSLPQNSKTAFTPQVDGEHTLRVIGYSGFGDYRIKLDLVDPQQQSSDQKTPLPLGTSTDGLIAVGAHDDYVFAATANTPLVATLATQDDLAFYFEVLDPDGAKVFSSNSLPRNSKTAFTPQVDGEHTLRLIGYSGFGNYSIKIDKQ